MAIARDSGGKSIACANIIKIGMSKAADAVLLASSVRNTTNVITANMIIQRDTPNKLSYMIFAKKVTDPDALNIVLNVSPPPNKSRIPLEVCLSISVQVMTLLIDNNTIAEIAITVSRSESIPVHFDNGVLRSQAVMVIRKMDNVIILSSVNSKGTFLISV